MRATRQMHAQHLAQAGCQAFTMHLCKKVLFIFISFKTFYFMYPSAVAVEQYSIHNCATTCRHSVKKGKQNILPLPNST